MKPRRLANLYIRHLEYLFSPPGLPLVSKSGPAGIPTTTVLVRGEAGAGKTTLATAVAYAIARDRKGVLLVLTTETSPVEVDVKVKFLRIPGKHVLSWEQRQSARKGSILVQHIALARSPDADPDGDAPPNILDTLWGLLQAYNEAEHAVPIVAVLIDGVLLADADAGPLVSRTDTAAFLQALESRGISTVIVEEKPPKATSWWPFVTDIVFELGFDTDPETKKLVRQLVCRKSRYTPAFAGPHEYDQDEDSILAVWPDPLDLDPSDLRKVRGKDATDPVLFWPLEDEGKCWVYRGGGLVCATISRQWDIVMAMDEPPSTSTLNIDPSDSNTHGNTSQGSLTPHPRAGAHAFAWQILRASRDYAYNAITIHTIDFLLSRIQSSATFSRLLRALLRSGFLIGIRGNEAEVGKLYPFANLTPDTWDMSGVRNLPKRSILGLERWLLSTATHPDALHHLSSWPTIQTIVSQGIASKSPLQMCKKFSVSSQRSPAMTPMKTQSISPRTHNA